MFPVIAGADRQSRPHHLCHCEERSDEAIAALFSFDLGAPSGARVQNRQLCTQKSLIGNIGLTKVVFSVNFTP